MIDRLLSEEGGLLCASAPPREKESPRAEVRVGFAVRARSGAVSLIAGILLLGAMLVTAAGAQTESPPPVAEATAVESGPIALSEVPARAVEAVGLLRAMESDIEPSPDVVAIETSLPDFSAQITAEVARASGVLDLVPSDDLLGELETAWAARRSRLAAWSSTLQERSRALERNLDSLSKMQVLWSNTRRHAIESSAPSVIVARISEVITEIRSVSTRTVRRQGEILTLQEKVGALGATADEILGQVRRTRGALVGQLVVRQGLPIWHWFRDFDDGYAFLSRAGNSFSAQFVTVAQYLSENRTGVVAHLLATGLVAIVLLRGRRRAAKWVEEEPALHSVMQTFSVPLSTALLLSLVSIPWLYPVAPIAVMQFSGLLALVPAVRLLKRVVPPPLFAGVYALGAFYIIDRVRSLLATSPSIEWSLFLVEMAAAIAMTRWVFSTHRAAQLGWKADETRVRVFSWLRSALLFLFSAAIVTASLGYVRLGALLGDGALGSGYAAILLYASAGALDGLWTYLLRSRALRRLHFVRDHRRLLQHRGMQVIHFVLLAAWVVVVLRIFALLVPISDLLSAVLGARLSRGNISVSLGDLVLFAGAVWVSFLLSRFVRFVLDEDIYRRVQLPHGASYAISTLLHYAVVIGGFLIGVAAIGFDMSRFAIVAGALGVGIGFGMQNIVNNFISGLILLFERPIQVGDAVEVGALSGEVRRIGIRSSTIRTWDGSEVIVPNGSLISDTVTNWTLSDRLRRIEIPVGVAYGTDPQRVLQVLGDVVRAHPEIIDQPPVTALFTDFGDSSLNFVVRGWTSQFERWVAVRSELMVAVTAALTEAGIEIPFPQRDLHLRTVDEGVARVLSAPVAGRE